VVSNWILVFSVKIYNKIMIFLELTNHSFRLILFSFLDFSFDSITEHIVCRSLKLNLVQLLQFLVESLLIVLIVVLRSYAHGLPVIGLIIMLSKQNKLARNQN
jgi:hypothetical protein